MYGLINDSIRAPGARGGRRGRLERIVEDAGAGSHTFAAMAYYDDELTYDLVGAASRELRSPPDVLLRKFGRYWSMVIAPESYGEYLAAAGARPVGGARGARRDALPAAGAVPASAPAVDRRRAAHGEHLITVNYRSEREGLAPFMVGLLEGLAEHLEVTASGDPPQVPGR